MASTLSIVVLVHRIGPYHNARLNALSKVCEVNVVEFSNIDYTYNWDSINANTAYKKITLFPEEAIEFYSIDEILRRMNQVLNQLAPRVVAIPGWSFPGSLAALAWCVESGTPSILMTDSTVLDEKRSWLKEYIKKIEK